MKQSKTFMLKSEVDRFLVENSQFRYSTMPFFSIPLTSKNILTDVYLVSELRERISPHDLKRLQCNVTSMSFDIEERMPSYKTLLADYKRLKKDYERVQKERDELQDQVYSQHEGIQFFRD